MSIPSWIASGDTARHARGICLSCLRSQISLTTTAKRGQVLEPWQRSPAFPNGKPNMRCDNWNDLGNSKHYLTKDREDAIFTRLRLLSAKAKRCRICTGANLRQSLHDDTLATPRGAIHCTRTVIKPS